jgi:hypothetical protein
VRLCNDRQMLIMHHDEKNYWGNLCLLMAVQPASASIVHYKRQAFIGTEYDIGLRDLDTSLTA